MQLTVLSCHKVLLMLGYMATEANSGWCGIACGLVAGCGHKGFVEGGGKGARRGGDETKSVHVQVARRVC